MVFNEWYGEIPFTLNRAVKKYNVSPSDFQTMESEGLSHKEIEAAIKQFSPDGYFQEFLFLRDTDRW